MKLVLVDTAMDGIFRYISESFKKNDFVIRSIKSVEEIEKVDDAIHLIVGLTNHGTRAIRRCKELGIPYWFVDHAYFGRDKYVRLVYNDVYWGGSRGYEWERYEEVGPKLLPWTEIGTKVIIIENGPIIGTIANLFDIEGWNNTIYRMVKLFHKEENIIVSSKTKNRVWDSVTGYNWRDAKFVVASYSNMQAEALMCGIPTISFHPARS